MENVAFPSLVVLVITVGLVASIMWHNVVVPVTEHYRMLKIERERNETLLENEAKVNTNQNLDRIGGKFSQYLYFLMDTHSVEFNLLVNDSERRDFLAGKVDAPKELNEVQIDRAYRSAFNNYVARQVKARCGKGNNVKVPVSSSVKQVLETV